MKVTLGGDRLGSGNKNKLALRNYERSTHNLSQKFTSSMQVGALYPFLVIPAMRGDTFEINLDGDARTIPTKGPLFGSFKVQYDVFQCPVRLYQAIMHNNPTSIGLKMNQVKLPIIELESHSDYTKGDDDPAKFKNNCLLKYLGISGIGQSANTTGDRQYKIKRNFNAVPILAYYDIFKNYYANKQEEYAYIITGNKRVVYAELDKQYIGYSLNGTFTEYQNSDQISFSLKAPFFLKIEFTDVIKNCPDNIILKNIYLGLMNTTEEEEDSNDLESYNKAANEYFPTNTPIAYVVSKENNTAILNINLNRLVELNSALHYINDTPNKIYIDSDNGYTYTDGQQESLQPFKLKQIDDMRMALLSWNNFGVPFTLKNTNSDVAQGYWGNVSGDTQNGLPYSKLFAEYDGDNYNSLFQLNGLALKTYQSDMFNNWVRTDWIDGENGINAITAVSTANGSFTMDALSLAEKLYNMLNRVAVSDGTYEGWQDAVYTESPKRHIESPVYLGGMSSEIVFEEIVQTAPAEGEPLGTLAGKGRLMKRKGGRVIVKCDEASFIIGIVSITPRINYTQGNEWYMTDLFSMDDFHKPALDGIGFQNLLQEQMHYAGTMIDEVTGLIDAREIAGKVPAWINYMTAVDKAYGDFASVDGNGFMVLQRNYEVGERGITDMTTYIDPRKFNYAFAYTDLTSQNFWVQIQSNITARRLMSAKQIPNL